MHPNHRITSAALRYRSPDLVDPATDVAVWLVKPAGVVTALGGRSRIDLAVARFLTGPAHELSARAHGKRQGLIAVHDWSTLAGYDPDARSLLVQWCLDHRREFEFSAVVSPPVNALLDMAITVASTTLRLAHVPFEVSTSLPELIRRMAITPA